MLPLDLALLHVRTSDLLVTRTLIVQRLLYGFSAAIGVTSWPAPPPTAP